MKHDPGALFDELASGDQLYAYTEASLDQLRALVPWKGRILDIGCGDGVTGTALNNDFTVAFDISPRCAMLAKKRGLKALVIDASKPLPFPDASFDVVVCFDVLHHLGGIWDTIFEEGDRVLRPGGAWVIVEPDARNPFVRWTQAPGSPIRVAPYDNEPAIDPASLEAHLKRRAYTFERKPIHIEAEQLQRSVFPLWQRLLKAPFVLAAHYWYRALPNKFVITATKPKSEVGSQK